MNSHPRSAWLRARFAPPSPHSRRRSALAAAFLLFFLLLAMLQSAAWAQQPGPPLDPPGRVARLNLADGAVSFAAADSGSPGRPDWTAAELNRPLTSGDRLWTGPRARSELHVGSTAIRMSEQTSLDFLTLDDTLTQLHLAQGSLQLRVRALFEGQRLEIDTPNLTFVISQPGDYRLDANPASDTTRVVVQSGGGDVYGDQGSAVHLDTLQQASFTGTQLAPAAPGATQPDSFDAWAADRDRREDQSVSARYIPREITGYQQLDDYGDWRQDPAYGAIWLPRAVPLYWAPYSMGHWLWIAPWGWTWVDDAPWGFAPFHYGRWAQIGPRWAWVPGRLPARPVYAPALVAFVGGGSVNWNISIGTGGPRPSIGWFPLAPGEAFRPTYRASPRYIAQMNNNIVINNTNKANNVYRYQRQPTAVTAISRDDFVRGRPVHGSRQALSAADLNRAPVVTDRSTLPQRPDLRESGRPAATLPPAALATRPFVGNRDNRPSERREATPSLQNEPRAERPANRPALTERQTPPVSAGAVGVPPPAIRPAQPTPPAPDRSAIDAGQRVQREQQQLQRDQERQQQDAQRRQADESLRQRALREQAQRNGSAPAVNPGARAAAERNAMEQAQRAQQQQRAEQAQRQQELARQQQVQQQAQQQAQQRAMHEQVQRQQEQARQQQQQAQQQQRAEQAQQRQASEQQKQQQQQQQELRREQAQERRAARPADNPNERGGVRPEGRARHNAEQ